MKTGFYTNNFEEEKYKKLLFKCGLFGFCQENFFSKSIGQNK